MNLYTLSKANLFASPVSGKDKSCSGNDRQLSAASAAADQQYSCEFGSNKYYALCGLGGVLSCGLTHTMVTPLDLVKCRLQVGLEIKSRDVRF